MLPCEKRQKIVKRPEGCTLYRCMNKQSGLHGCEVNEAVCLACPVRVVQHKRPCRQRPETEAANVSHVTTKEMLDVTDAEVMQMIEEAGMDPSEFTRAEPTGDSELPPNYPPVSVQLWTYKEALIRWNKAGRPTRSQDEVTRIHTECCQPCEWYDKEKSRCKGCGCKVTIGSIAVLNKLKMATEKCPKGKF